MLRRLHYVALDCARFVGLLPWGSVEASIYGSWLRVEGSGFH